MSAVFSAATQAADKAGVVLWRWSAWPRRAIWNRAAAALGPGCMARLDPATVPSWPWGHLQSSISSQPGASRGEVLLGAVVPQWWSQGVTSSPQRCCRIPGALGIHGVPGKCAWGVNSSAELWVCHILTGGWQHVYKYRFTVALFESSKLPLS